MTEIGQFVNLVPGHEPPIEARVIGRQVAPSGDHELLYVDGIFAGPGVVNYNGWSGDETIIYSCRETSAAPWIVQPLANPRALKHLNETVFAPVQKPILHIVPKAA